MRAPLLDDGSRRSLLIGGSLALVFSLVPFTRFVFGYLGTLVHEMGHCAAGWIFGYPSIPAFDFMHGGGVTLHQDRSLVVLAAVYVAFGWLLYRLRSRRATLAAGLTLAGLYTLAAFTPLHELIRLSMGHGAELIVSGIFIYRALSGEKAHGERPAYAFAGLFMLLTDMRFAYGLMTSHERRVEYEMAKGGGGWMDLSLIARTHLGLDLETVAALLLVCCALPVAASLLVLRYRDEMISATARLLGEGAPVNQRCERAIRSTCSR